MTPSFIIKFSGLLLVSWVTLGAGPSSSQQFGILCGLLMLMAFLDAGQASLSAGASKDGALEISVFLGRLLSLNGSPFYLALMIFTFIGMNGINVDKRDAIIPVAASASMCGAEGGGCGSKGGCGSGGCGSSSGGSCGCSSKSKAKPQAQMAASPQRPLSQDELRQRAAEVQKRALNGNPNSAGGLPGLGNNPRPLPPGLVPKAGAVVPPGIVVPASPPERTAPGEQTSAPSASASASGAATPLPPSAADSANNSSPKLEASPTPAETKPASVGK